MKRIIALIFVIMFCFSLLSGCEAEALGRTHIDWKHIEYGWGYDVYCDMETRVMYLTIEEVGITPLYNADGTLRLYKGD